MSLSMFLDGDKDDHKQQRSRDRMINGPRPSPLKIKQQSQTIHKHQPSSSSSLFFQPRKNHHQRQKIRKPVIIYTHSPKVIHTKAHDFMALVQKLTGRSCHEEEEEEEETLQQEHYDQDELYDQNNESSNNSGVTDEKDGIIRENSLMLSPPLNPYLADVPLFTPNSSDFFCSPRHLFRFSDMLSSSSPNMGNSLSPASLVELMKGLE